MLNMVTECLRYKVIFFPIDIECKDRYKLQSTSIYYRCTMKNNFGAVSSRQPSVVYSFFGRFLHAINSVYCALKMPLSVALFSEKGTRRGLKRVRYIQNDNKVKQSIKFHFFAKIVLQTIK